MGMTESRKIRLTFIEDILGSQPLDPNVYRDFVLSKAPPEKPQEDLDAEIALIGMDNNGSVGDLQKGMTGFHADAGGVYLMAYQVLGFLKNAALKLAEPMGITALRSQIVSYVFVAPQKILLAKELDGVCERPLMAQTAQGPRTALAASQMVASGATIEFDLKILPSKDICWLTVERLLDYGELQGIGQWRGSGKGAFLWGYADKNTKDETPFVNKSAEVRKEKAAKKAAKKAKQ